MELFFAEIRGGIPGRIPSENFSWKSWRKSYSDYRFFNCFFRKFLKVPGGTSEELLKKFLEIFP